MYNEGISFPATHSTRGCCTACSPKAEIRTPTKTRSSRVGRENAKSFLGSNRDLLKNIREDVWAVLAEQERTDADTTSESREGNTEAATVEA